MNGRCSPVTESAPSKRPLSQRHVLSGTLVSASVLILEGFTMSDSEPRERFEIVSGLTLALLAAVTAVNDLQAGKYGEDEIMGHNQRASAYAWYQSKSIKETAVTQELSLLNSLLAAGALSPDVKPSMEKRTSGLENEVNRYKAEKNEILKGSTAVGAAGQVLADKNGEKGNVIGAQEWESKLGVLEKSGDLFDCATLWLQLSLVCGAISLVLKRQDMKKGFYIAMILLGILGAFYSFRGWNLALTA